MRLRLVEAASELYADGGSAGLSFAALARRVGITKATVFHYFPTKEALVSAVFESLGERLAAAAATWFDPPPASFAARLDRLIGSLVDFWGGEPRNARILCRGLLETSRLVAGEEAASRPVFFDFIARFERFLAAGIEAGEFYPERPLATIMAIGGVVLFEFMLPAEAERVGARVGVVPLDRRRRELVAFVRRAVVRPAAGRRRRVRAAAGSGTSARAGRPGSTPGSPRR